jgi:hypothetical protein
LRPNFGGFLAETVLFPRTTRTTGANDRGILSGSLGYPANVQYRANAVELAASARWDGARATTDIATGFYLVNGFQRVNILCAQCRREVYARTQDMRVACSILAANGLTAIKVLLVSATQYRNLRRRFG